MTEVIKTPNPNNRPLTESKIRHATKPQKTNADTYNKCCALLELGLSNKEISERLGVHRSTIKGWNDSRRTNYIHEKSVEVGEIHPQIMDIAIEQAKIIVEDPTIVGNLEVLKKGVDSFQVLDTKFHETMTNALERADALLKNDKIKVNEFVSITKVLGDAYNNIFNNKGVQVNVNNGQQFSTDKLSMFKGSLRD